jgi:hypothetical protein
MIKPQMPNIPGVGVVTDTLDFVKNLWGSMSVPGVSLPGMASPTLSVDELDKKIADLKAVESWLNVNTAMLRGTIQALEVQRGTIATLKSMGASLAAAVKQPGANEKTVLAAAPYASAFFAQPEAPAADEKTEEPADKSDETPNPAAAMGNPSVWWNLLQDQFKQAVNTAMAPDAIAGASARAQELGKTMAKNFAAAVPKAAMPKKAASKAGTSKTAASASAAKPAAKKRAPAKKRAAAKPKASQE